MLVRMPANQETFDFAYCNQATSDVTSCPAPRPHRKLRPHIDNHTHTYHLMQFAVSVVVGNSSQTDDSRHATIQYVRLSAAFITHTRKRHKITRYTHTGMWRTPLLDAGCTVRWEGAWLRGAQQVMSPQLVGLAPPQNFLALMPKPKAARPPILCVRMSMFALGCGCVRYAIDETHG